MPALRVVVCPSLLCGGAPALCSEEPADQLRGVVVGGHGKTPSGPGATASSHPVQREAACPEHASRSIRVTPSPTPPGPRGGPPALASGSTSAPASPPPQSPQRRPWRPRPPRRPPPPARAFQHVKPSSELRASRETERLGASQEGKPCLFLSPLFHRCDRLRLIHLRRETTDMTDQKAKAASHDHGSSPPPAPPISTSASGRGAGADVAFAAGTGTLATALACLR